jgi:hypothetical protein
VRGPRTATDDFVAQFRRVLVALLVLGLALPVAIAGQGCRTVGGTADSADSEERAKENREAEKTSSTASCRHYEIIWELAEPRSTGDEKTEKFRRVVITRLERLGASDIAIELDESRRVRGRFCGDLDRPREFVVDVLSTRGSLAVHGWEPLDNISMYRSLLHDLSDDFRVLWVNSASHRDSWLPPSEAKEELANYRDATSTTGSTPENDDAPTRDDKRRDDEGKQPMQLEGPTLLRVALMHEDRETLRKKVAPRCGREQVYLSRGAPKLGSETGSDVPVEWRSFCVEAKPVFTDAEVTQATVHVGPRSNRHEIDLVVEGTGSDRLEAWTRRKPKSRLVFVLDGEVVTTPRLQGPVPTGDLKVLPTDPDPEMSTAEEERIARRLAIFVATGSLPVEVEEVRLPDARSMP